MMTSHEKVVPCAYTTRMFHIRKKGPIAYILTGRCVVVIRAIVEIEKNVKRMYKKTLCERASEAEQADLV